MNPEKTAAFALGEGPATCLLIHGFTGSPWDLRPLGEELAQRGFKVHCRRLPGHGTSPEAMKSVTARDWEQSTQDTLMELSTQGPIYVAGFSMGGLLALLLAARFPHQVKGLGLIAPAVHLQGRQPALVRRLRHTPFLDRFIPWVYKESTDIEDEQARAEAPILPAYPAVRLNDLFTLQDAAMDEAGRVRCPTLIAMAQKDHVVSYGGGAVLARALTLASSVRFISLREGFHIVPRDAAGRLLAEELAQHFLRA